MGKLAGAILTSLSGALQAVAKLVTGLAPSFGILANVLGTVFTAMENAGVFGILENALEQIAGPLGTMIGLLVSGLAPILGRIIIVPSSRSRPPLPAPWDRPSSP